MSIFYHPRSITRSARAIINPHPLDRVCGKKFFVGVECGVLPILRGSIT
ncbi:hypothetical protein C789_4680 [Microcystis aeruginosa FACHB-905 = DIANCHI905]|uniref:Uncharacterized protein n=1 Tax=Microcystis aeruginosa PCC 7806SL TaxID=1903187 RepID=A0AB33BL88_MICA7|nr:hypothetical protein BH695_0395 [Microcystis aeruginosa PCC 7806SL]ELS45526.1 hypothetical protein C789_4680 [Microcystis aeruginosa FACHB-905 = DIANCHI905]